MSGFRSNTYAKIWSVEPGKGKFTKVKLSVSHKSRDTGAYETDFSDYCMFIGDAHTKGAKLREGDRIQLKDVEVTNSYNKETKKMYYNFKVFSFDMADAAPSGNAAAAKSKPAPRKDEGENEVDGEGEELPF